MIAGVLVLAALLVATVAPGIVAAELHYRRELGADLDGPAAAPAHHASATSGTTPRHATPNRREQDR